MDGLLPITDAGKELITQGIGYTLFIVALWYVGRKEQELKDERTAHKVEIVEKDKLIQQLQESRVDETRTLVEAVGEINTALLANKTSIDSLMPLLQQIASSRR